MFLEVFLIGLILSVDSFTAAVSMGTKPFTRNDALKFALSSGGAEAFVAFIGAIAGNEIVTRFKEYDHWVAFGLLILVALHMLKEGIEQLNGNDASSDSIIEEKFHGPIKIIIVSFATSLDAFGVGIGLGAANKPLLPNILSIATWAFIATLLGLNLSRKLSKKFGPIMSIVASIVLVILAFQMLSI